jgi:hypothetical protein
MIKLGNNLIKFIKKNTKTKGYIEIDEQIRSMLSVLNNIENNSFALTEKDVKKIEKAMKSKIIEIVLEYPLHEEFFQGNYIYHFDISINSIMYHIYPSTL